MPIEAVDMTELIRPQSFRVGHSTRRGLVVLAYMEGEKRTYLCLAPQTARKLAQMLVEYATKADLAADAAEADVEADAE
jgi:hypothetical protein